MKKQGKYILTVVGRDQVGIVSQVTRILYQAGCNLENSDQTILQGQFAMMLVFSLDQHTQLSQLETHLDDLSKRLAISCVVRKLPQRVVSRPESKKAGKAIATLRGHDAAGLVYNVSSLLARHHINIENISTHLHKATEGEPFYYMVMYLEIPKSCDRHKIKTALDKMANSLAVEITLQDKEIFAAMNQV